MNNITDDDDTQRSNNVNSQIDNSVLDVYEINAKTKQ